MLRTKAPVSTDELGDRYCMLGPYVEDRVKLEVEILEPEFPPMKAGLKHLRDQGFLVRFAFLNSGCIHGLVQKIFFEIRDENKIW